MKIELHHTTDELKQFFREVFLKPCKSQTVIFELDFRSFSYWSTERKAWTIDPGEFIVSVGTSSRNIRYTETLNL